MTLDRPTISERYIRATESSHLEMVSERVGDVDILVASGWVADSLGTKLYRLRAEWDSVRAEQRQAEANLRAQSAAARSAELIAADYEAIDPQALAAHLAARRARLQRAAEDAALTARALILVRMGSLATTREALGRYADILATRTRFMKPVAVVVKIAGRALDFWLDPSCPVCTGRMFSGEFGAPQIICKPCSGTGRRQYQLHDSDAGHQFGRSLLAEMDRKTDVVDQKMKAYLRQHGRPPNPAAAIVAMQAKLDDLRSAQAQED